jgi:hypothetical protein
VQLKGQEQIGQLQKCNSFVCNSAGRELLIGKIKPWSCAVVPLDALSHSADDLKQNGPILQLLGLFGACDSLRSF